MARLMVVEDDETIGALLESQLRMQDHEVTWVRAGRTAVREAAMTEFDLVLLDLGLPDVDGVEVCRQLRQAQPGCVLVMLTARQEEMDVVVGLDAGADDYLTKPFGLTELIARVRAHLRRGVPAAPRHTIVIGDLVVDTAARRSTVAGQEVKLRPKEFDLLARLAEDLDAAVTREQLIDDVWDINWSGSTKTLDVHIAALRSRLAEAAEPSGAVIPQIVTLRGHGYRLEGPPS
ncbi:response regulator transcription factor [Actinomadura barringtoniae]|uniref:Response regulator transcription factor n=1 Tax=Actinomadura barringtoniae TaxID=1427535 RepID=A0A939PR46_9ACTN|nr:response regulator transcription factor [Actinomadura barringtoniae]MBO2453226.1 response regulator transcription factor [Actinomadura barringtoniae]